MCSWNRFQFINRSCWKSYQKQFLHSKQSLLYLMARASIMFVCRCSFNYWFTVSIWNHNLLLKESSSSFDKKWNGYVFFFWGGGGKNGSWLGEKRVSKLNFKGIRAIKISPGPPKESRHNEISSNLIKILSNLFPIYMYFIFVQNMKKIISINVLVNAGKHSKRKWSRKWKIRHF